MIWPWSSRIEKRQQSGGAYTDAIVSLIQAQASGNAVGEPSALAALEIAAGLWSRAFASAELDPPIAPVTPSFLASVARQLVRRGESLWAIDILRGEIVLTPTASWDVAGDHDVRSWVYRLDLAAPSGAKTRIYPSASVLHFRYAPEPERPWTSPSPLGFARATGRLASNLELRLGEEAGSRVGYLLPVPADGGDGSVDDPLASLKSDLGSLAGNTALVETTSAGYAEGRAAAPQSDWKSQRMGANPPATLAELRGAAAVDVLAACGVPPGLASAQSEGTSQRESWRRFGIGMAAVGRTVSQELSDKLDMPELTITFEAMGSADLAGKARAVGTLTKAGVPLARSLELAGLKG